MAAGTTNASTDSTDGLSARLSRRLVGWKACSENGANETRPDTRFILLHQVKNDDNIRLFFQECWEAYLKVCG